MNRIGLFVVWAVATGVATVLAWQVVGAADDQISDAPTTPLIALTAPDTSREPDSTSDTTTTDSTTSTTHSSSPTSTASATGSSTTSTTTPTDSTSTTAPEATTTTASGVSATTTAVSDGGTVTVTGVEPNVELVAVVAVPGWSYQVTGDDGTRVEVTFTSLGGEEIRVRCQWENGRLQADIDDD